MAIRTSQIFIDELESWKRTNQFGLPVCPAWCVFVQLVAGQIKQDFSGQSVNRLIISMQTKPLTIAWWPV